MVNKVNALFTKKEKAGTFTIVDTKSNRSQKMRTHRNALESKNRVMEVHQVGKVTKKHKKPVSRERKAIRDIRRSPDYNGAKIKYHRI